MKKILPFIIVIITLSLALDVQAQSPLIKITDDKDVTVSKSGNDNITAKMVSDPNGFIISVSPPAAFTSLIWKDATGKFDPKNTIKGVPHGNAGNVLWFTVKGAASDDATKTLTIQLINDKVKPADIKTLTISYVPDSQNPGTGSSPPLFGDVIPPITCNFPQTSFTSTKANATDKCGELNVGNNFGELVENYDLDKTTYVYNFKTNVRTWFKITKDKKTQKLVTELVNFNKIAFGPNQHFLVKIVNVNRFLFDVTINHSFSSSDSQPSALFTQFFIGDSNLLGSLMSAYSKGLDASAQSAGSGPEATTQNTLEDLLLRIRCFYEKYNGYHAQMIQAYNPCSVFNCCQEFEYHQFANELMYIKFEMAQLQGQLSQSKVILALKKDTLAKCLKAATDLAAAKKTLAAATKQADKDTANKKITQLTKQVRAPADQQKLIADTLKASAAATAYAALSDLLMQLPANADIEKMALFINAMSPERSIYTIDEETIRGNQYNLFVQIKARDSLVKLGYLADELDTLNISRPVVRKPFVSFSSGSFMALGSNLKSKTYDLQPLAHNKIISDTSRYVLAESGYSIPVIGFSALGNIEWKMSESFGVGGSVGVGLTIESNPRLNYLGGASLFFGNNKQFVTSFGLTATQFNMLSNNLLAASQQGIQYNSTDKPAITYYKTMRTGFFISVTFTPFTSTQLK
jgi:hypothetical protein